MELIPEIDTLEERAAYGSILDEPEHEGLLRMTRLAQHLFHVPMAYLALLGPGCTVTTRIGSGAEHWRYLKTYPLSAALARPMVWPVPSGAPVPGFIPGDLQFAAAAPLRSSDGLELGLLVIADTKAKPEFSAADLATVEELAGVLAGKMELRLLASGAREAERMLRETEDRFRSIANCAPVMLLYSAVDGGVSFVNEAWERFTGRSREEDLGDGYAEVIHADHREAVLKTWWDAFERRGSFMVRYPMRRFDGAYRWVEARGNPRFLSDGSFAGYIGCCIELPEV